MTVRGDGGAGRLDAMRRLTARERDVLALVAEGSSNSGIAARLGLTVRTVETHTSRIFTKLDLGADEASHRRVLAALAYLRGHLVADGRGRPDREPAR